MSPEQSIVQAATEGQASWIRRLGLLAGPALFFVTWLFFEPAGLSGPGRAVLATTLWTAVWWVTEAVPIPVTSLLPILLFPLTGGLDLGATTSAYGSPMVFLFLGGFILAIALERWNLHRRIALNIIAAVGTSASRLVLGFMLAAAFLSMWISNTATTLMMVPIGMAVVSQICSAQPGDGRLGKALMLGIAYAASIGGISTLIGTPTNVLFTGAIMEFYGTEVSFAGWMLLAAPLAMVLLVLCWLYLTKIALPLAGEVGEPQAVHSQLRALGPLSHEERMVALIFGLTALAWITRSFLLTPWLPGISDTAIALMGAATLFLVPARSQPGSALLDWESAARLPWGILLLFGGGLALAAAFKSSGLADWMGGRLAGMEGLPLWLILLATVALVNFLTEITSNVATASALLPILASLSLAIDVHPYGLMIGTTLAASCAFMLPVATPPNAIVFGSGCIGMRDMVRAGFAMNLLSIALIVVYLYWVMPWLMDLDLSHFPAAFQS
jgi:sodium-dependent dicarboxylate transporter 2/3/5